MRLSAGRACSSSRLAFVGAALLVMTFATAPEVRAAAPPPPVLVAPIGPIPDPDPTYTWNVSAGATQYTLQVFDSGGTRVLLRQYDASSVCSGGVCSRTEALVLALGDYTWRVRAQNAQGSTLSGSVGFTVIPPAAPVAYAPSGPLTNPTPTYTWSSSAGATVYRHVVFDNAGAAIYERTYAATSVCTGQSCAYSPGVTLGMGGYSWTIRANHSAGGTTSAPKYFHLSCEARVVLGDFNGDSRTDRLCSISGATHVSLSTGTGFVNGAVWLGTFIEKPLAGDFNADGRTDIGGYDRFTGVFRVALSNGTAFGAWTQWGVATVGGVTCSGSGPDVYAADFNGDGRTDVSCKKQNITGVYVGLSTGTGFSFSIFGDTFCGTNEHTGTMDIDGDGKSDWFCLAPASDIMLVYPSTGSGFRSPVSAADASFCDDAQYIMGDWNGDGRTDLGCFGNGKTRLSTGNAYLDQTPTGAWCANPYNEEWPYAFGGDVDGDGAAEMICGGMSSWGNAVSVRKWTGESFGPPEVWIPGFCWGYSQTGDFDGDGKTDLLCEHNQDVAGAGTSRLRADLMIEASSPLGGTETVGYQPATDFPNGPGFGTAPVATAVAVSDGRGSTATTTYAYANGKTNKLERQSLGFQTVTATLPCLATETPPCPNRQTTFMQGLASAGSVLQVLRRAGNGTILSKQAYTYDERTALPRRSRLASSTSTTIGPPGTERATTVTFDAYDEYGNLTQSTAGGDPADAQDDLQTNSSFAYNTSAYIVDRVGLIERRAPQGAALTKEERWYDNQGSWQSAPIKGDLTTLRRWLDRESRWVARTFEYTESGMLRRVTDETARPIVSFDYDPSWGLFPVLVTTPLGEIQQTWNFGCGTLESTTDLNEQTTTTDYDAFCRIARTDDPAGGFVEHKYLDDGNPALQRTRVETNAPPGVSGVAWTTSYVDGLGRNYRTVSRAAAQIVVDKTFNPRGGVHAATEPYYVGETALVTGYEYDGLDRVTKVTLPGSGTILTSYTASSQTTTDPNGKPTTTRFDHFGRVKTIERPFKGQPATTTTHYDRLGRRDWMTDPERATWTWGYDSLGRVRDEADPDRGTWHYEYDEAGRLTIQTDAKSQETTLEYDTPGRLWRRQNAAGTTVYTYDEPRRGFFNLGRLTTVTYTHPTRPVSILRFDYDQLGRVQQQWPQVDGTTYKLTKTWAPGGYHESTRYPDHDVISILYDEVGRVTSIPGILNAVSYDASGRPRQKTNANGTTTTWSYSPTRGVLEGIVTTSSAGLVQDLGYTIDDAGLVRELTSSVTGEGWQYDYDELDHLETATNPTSPGDSQTFHYDAAGRMEYNSRVGTYTYPLVGQPRPHAPASANGVYTYDANGNLESGGGREPTWNADNLIDQLGATQFSYDGLGERVKKTNGSTTSLYPFGDDYEITDGVTTKYISVEGLGVVAKKVTGGSNDPGTHWIHTDRLGSIDAVTNLGGTIEFQRIYRPYGETLAQGGDHTESRGWIDQRNDPETGLTYLHARHFDPRLGTFLSPDPIGVAGGMNLYAYALGNPVNGTDRGGLLNDDHCLLGKCQKIEAYNFTAYVGVTAYVGSLLAQAITETFLRALSERSTGSATGGSGDGAGGGTSGGGGGEHAGVCTEGPRGVECSTQVSVTVQVGAEWPNSAYVRVYSSPAFGPLGRPLGLNHAFVYSEGTGRGKGMNGSSGLAFDDGNGVGDLDSPYVLAPLPPGMSEEEFMRRIAGADGWNNGVWCPFGNDCHSQLDDAFWQAGVRYPGAPNGRMDIDDDFWAAALRIARRYAYPWWGW
jgi:RHS repeat-associated protein